MSQHLPAHDERRAPNKGGRPTKLTKATAEVIIKHVRLGGYLEVASDLAGVSRASVRAWLKRGHKEPKSRYGWFLRATRKALAEAQQGNLLHVMAARQQNWQSAAWLLERRWPEEWGRKERLEHTGKGGGPIRSMSVQVVNLLDRLPVETVRAIMEAREQAENEALTLEHRDEAGK